MKSGKFRLGQGGGEAAQFSGLFTEEALDISTATVLNANENVYAKITLPNGSTRIHITDDGVPTSVGTFVESGLTVVVPAGWYFSADTAVNVTPQGFDPEA